MTILLAVLAGAAFAAGKPACAPLQLPPHVHLVKANGEQISPSKLSSTAKGETVFIKADVDVKYAEFMRVLNGLQDCGIYKVSLITEARAQ